MEAALITYLSAGVAVYVALYLLLKRAGFSKEARSIFEGVFVLEALLFWILFWPIKALLILAEYWRLVSKRAAERKRAEERALKVEREGRYADMSMDALLEAQRRVLQKADEPPRAI